MEIGFTKQQINQIFSITPSIGYTHKSIQERFNSILSLFEDKNKLMNIIVKCGSLLTIETRTLFEKIDVFYEYGFKKTDLINMIYNNYSLFTNKKSKIKENLMIFSKIFSSQKLVSFFRKNPIFINYKPIFFTNKLQLFYNLTLLGFSLNEIKNIIIKSALLLGCKSNRYIKQFKMIKEINSFSDEEVRKMINKNPILLSLKEENIINTFNFFLNFGFDIKSIKNIFIRNSKVILNDNLKFEKNLNKLLEYFSFEETEKIVSLYPSILAISYNNLNEKLKLYHLLDIEFIFTTNPMDLIQGCERTYQVYQYFFNEFDKEITLENKNLLFTKNNNIKGKAYLDSHYPYLESCTDSISETLRKRENNGKKIICLH